VKKIMAVVASVALGIGALACTAAPKSQCQDGSTKVTHGSGGTKTYHCHNGEWVR